MKHPENAAPFELAKGDWIIHAGPSIIGKKMDFSVFAVYVVEATPSHIVGYFPHAGANFIFDRLDFPNWRQAGQEMVRLTWENAIAHWQSNRPQSPITQAELSKYGVVLERQ